MLHIFFNSVKGKHRSFTLIHQKSAPNRHALEPRAFLKKPANVVAKRAGECDGAAGLCESVEAVKFWRSFVELDSRNGAAILFS